MKNNTLAWATVLLLFAFASCRQQQTSFELKGEITGLADSIKVILVPGATHQNEKPFAEAYVQKGRFSMSGKLDEPRLFHLRVADTYGGMPLMLENASMKLSAEAVLEERNGNASVNFSNVQLKGSELQKLYKQKMAFKDTLSQKYDDYHKGHEATLAILGLARQQKNKQQTDSIQNTEDYQMFAKAEKAFFDDVEAITNEAIMDNKDSFWGPLVMLESMSYFTDGQKPLYESFSPEAKDSYYGKIVRKELYPEKMVGKSVPTFELSDKDGTPFRSEKLMEGKKYVLIDFWASWCAPCRKEIPNLKRIYAGFSPKGLQIISVSIDKKKADWLKALTEENMPWPNLLDEKGIDKQFMVRYIPALFLVDQTGTVIADDLRGEALYQKLKELF